ncbi:phage/plasmid primase, P4 family [Mycolicibacterium frederiksbergense]
MTSIVPAAPDAEQPEQSAQRITRRRNRLQAVSNQKTNVATAVALPDVTGMSCAEAAEAYAKAGCHVIPIRPGTKNPGSYLGNGWQQQATDDLDKVRDWWTRWPDAWLALHAGASGFLVIDIDKPENATDELWRLVEGALYRRTEADPANRRGHYFYALKPGERFGNGLGKLKPARGKKWGEVRCYSGCIVVAPTPHLRATEGASYSPTPAGPVPMRPDELAQKLTELPEPEWRELQPLSVAELDARTQTFLDTYTDDREPFALASMLKEFDLSGRHESMWDALCWAMREAKAGRFPAKRADDMLCNAWERAFEGGYRDGDPDEYARMRRDAIHNADNAGTVEELWDRAHRDIWPSPAEPQKVAEQITEKANAAAAPLGYWRGEWYRFNGKCWAPTSDDTMSKHLYDTLRDARYEKGKDGETTCVEWTPEKAKVDRVLHALKAEVLIPDDHEEDSWADGRDEPMIAFSNGLLRVRDRKLIPHTPTYFSTEYLRFDYNPNAKMVGLQRFLDDLTGSDAEAIEALLGFIGTRLVVDNRFQKLLIIVGRTGSGKGTLDRLLSNLLGSRHGSYAMDDFKNSSFPTEPLLGRTLVTISDQRAQLNAKKFTDLLLQIVGQDSVTLRLPYVKRSITKRLPLTFLILSNEVPVLPDNAGAVLRRVIILSSPNSFAGKEDVDLFDKLSAELPALVNVALDAYDRLRERGKFVQPESGLVLLDMLRQNASYLEEFVKECCEVGPDLEVPKSQLLESWQNWCRRNGHNATGVEKFASDLYSLPITPQIIQSRPTIDGKRVQCFKGLTLKAPAKEHPKNVPLNGGGNG